MAQVPGSERAKLVQELLELIEGKVMAIVMKHDASRVVQTALQFGNREVFYRDVRTVGMARASFFLHYCRAAGLSCFFQPAKRNGGGDLSIVAGQKDHMAYEGRGESH